MPTTPPAAASVTASTRNCVRMSLVFAPAACRSPISRVRSVTDTSMMFMMPIPPTMSETDAMAASRIDITRRGLLRGEHLLEVANREVVLLARRDVMPLAKQGRELLLGVLDLLRALRLHLDRAGAVCPGRVHADDFVLYSACCFRLLPSRAVYCPVVNDILELFDRTGAYLRGHFRLTSGLHSPEYLQCALVLQHPEHAERLGKRLAGVLSDLDPGRRVDVVASPAIGGLIIGHEVARALGARFIFTERDASAIMTLRRGFAVHPGESAVVVEDVVTTGGSSREVVEALRKAGVSVLGAGSIIDRSGGQADLGAPRVALATLKVVTYPPDDCPLCRQGMPVVKPGSRPAAAP